MTVGGGTLAIGIDVGTQGIKGVLLDGERAGGDAVVSRAHEPLSLLEGLPPGAAEQDPNDWWSGVRKVLGTLLAAEGIDRTAIGAIGISGQQHGSVFLDETGLVVRPAKLWCDTSTARWAREISDRSGRSIPVGFTASKVAWLAAREPERWRRTTSVLLPHDFVNLRLTGRAVMEAGDASGTGYFDPITRDWDLSIARSVHPDLADKLPPLIPTTEAVGTLLPAVAEEFGLSPKTRVSCGGGDNMMSAIGAGATRAGVVVVSLGTSATVFTRASQPVVDPAGLIAPFCSSDGAWLPLLCTMNCTNVTEEVRAAFGIEGDEALRSVTEAAAALPAGCDGVSFIPFLQGERVPDLPEATASLVGLRPGSLRAPLIWRAALEGVTCNLALGVERLRALGVPVDEVRLVGGGARNPLWRTLIADLLDVTVRRPVEGESAALGAAMQALTIAHDAEPAKDLAERSPHDALAQQVVALEEEILTPDPERRASLRPVLERYRTAIAALDETAP